MNLVIDIGNSFAKIALFNNRDLKELYVSASAEPAEILQFIGDRKISNSIVSSVRPEFSQLEDFLKSATNYYRFTASSATFVTNLYNTPHTLGLDRYAGIIGASALFSGKDCLVIDAGTCITYDFIDFEKRYFGGSISPGLTMRFKAMHAFTGKLPLEEPNEVLETVIGTDTKTALQTGAQYGALFEVEGFIKTYLEKYPNLNVALCGGDVKFFDRHLKNSIFAPVVKTIPDLVLIGLNEVIQQYND